MFIYVITNSVTGKIYIGQHKGNNLKKYLQMKLSQAVYELKRKGKGGSSHLFNSMRKHPKEVWSIAPLFEGITTREELNRLEILLIALYDTRNPDIGYNICKGGEGFTGEFTAEHRRKMRENASRYWLGKIRSCESVEKQVSTRRASGRYLVPNPSPEALAKQIASRRAGAGWGQNIGRRNPEGTKEKMRLSYSSSDTLELRQRRGAAVAKTVALRNAHNIAEVKRLREKGHTFPQIARQVGVSIGTARNWMKPLDFHTQ
jgi:hypothetical protein